MNLRSESRLPITCSVTFSGYKLELEGRVKNLSLSGCALETEEPIEPGTPLFLSVSLPDSDEPIEIELASVRWAHEGACGLKTIIMGLESRERLQTFLEENLSQDPNGVASAAEEPA